MLNIKHNYHIPYPQTIHKSPSVRSFFLSSFLIFPYPYPYPYPYPLPPTPYPLPPPLLPLLDLPPEIVYPPYAQ